MRNFFIFLWISLISFSIYAQNSRIPFYEQLYFDSKALSGQMPIQVYLPADYGQIQAKYQVHYVYDGILNARMYAGIADHYSQLNLMPEIIVVGLNLNRRYGSTEFSEFLEEELVPYINSIYHTVPFRLLAGHSSSGEQTLYQLFKGSGIFHGFIAGSPTGLDKIRIPENYLSDSTVKFIYTSIGENDFPDILEQYPGFLDRTKPSLIGVPFYSGIIQGSSHYGCFPVIINNALLKLFENWQFSLPEGQYGAILPMVKTHYQELSDQFGYQVIMPEKTIFRLSYQWIYRDLDNEHAIELLEYGILNYPQSGFLFHLLGRTYHNLGKYEPAEKYYLKALERVPGYEVAIKDYETLKKENR